ncbi:ParB/RepB/Spo0J family partition protein [Dechloromonas sp. TW-R-39-2]|uniref:plasmid partitioning protein RepB C-terminal domain-containing protein n=1 Tax=Dechloromonas sp. TW-R-39-2 TaxID=2654218 RepID=UPI001AF2C5BA|nr:plasmid partitioning protein RepB C-terminal domain-containing protein [Dechloromonas sp. TW-R-39-2]QRM20976.1 ParB/RepB/Spo0J family partition protein [Dechloromonas sp. TW-R-39-2]
MLQLDAKKVEMLPVELIRVLNPRERNQRSFEGIVESIRNVGLKKPIVVTRRANVGGQHEYALVCGEGRLSAFRMLGEKQIPALVVEASDEDAYIMSLVENIARRQYRPLEILRSIKQLSERGYSPGDIGKKTALSSQYVSGILKLLSCGEERLLMAVEKGMVPLNTALDIVSAGEDNVALQTAMQEAYESGLLRGTKLTKLRRILERRTTLGPSLNHISKRKRTNVTSASLVRVYEKEVERKKLILRKADLTQKRLLFVTSALRQLLSNEHFVNLLRAEQLDVMPMYLAERVWPEKIRR